MLDYGLDMSGVERDLALPDLVAEGGELDTLVAAQTDWSKPTPAAGWTIAHQIAHLASADANVSHCYTDPAGVRRCTEAGRSRKQSIR
ncbi:maleylpyruvate isomerase N-terminal domain-containing protein [Nocardia sp. NPDC004604]|uniref:maleylpyruvate isomerase N-terminal domain-containing protein n=1 Tax=Nocardia sp. NPDC004604 TaxID=3157013 RepID=UPI00339FA93A